MSYNMGKILTQNEEKAFYFGEVKDRNRFLREVVETPSLEICKTCLDEVLSNLL